MAGTIKRTPRRLRAVSVTVLVVLGLTAFAGSAAAGPSQTPNGYCGALNMKQASGVGAQGGMTHAMVVDNPNGNEGMFRAVTNSVCR